MDATNTSCSNLPCPHSEGKGAPVCWDCAEEGHIYTPSVAYEGGLSPNWQKIGGLRGGNISRSTISSTGTQASDLEVHLPEGGLEVGTPRLRLSQAGLIVVDGPRAVSPEDKLRKPELQSLNPESHQKEDVESTATSNAEWEPTAQSIWGLRKRTFQILVVIAILALVGVIIGIAVGATRQKVAHSTSLSVSGGGQASLISSSMPPITTTKITSLHVTASASTFITLVGTGKPTSSRRADGVQTSSGTTTATEEKGGCQGSKPTAIAANATTVFIVTQLPTPTDTIRPQPTSKASSAPAPEKTSSPASPQPTPHFSSRVCLGDDGSTYTDPGTGDTFKIECTASHQGKDIVNLEAQTMEECVSLCAKNTHCKGAAWYNVGPQGTDLNYCWLKSEMADDVRITADAQSVVRL